MAMKKGGGAETVDHRLHGGGTWVISRTIATAAG